MKTFVWIACLCVLLASVACQSAASRGAAAKKALGDPRPEVRAAAAAVLQKLETENPEAIGDHGEAHWKRVLATIPPGATGTAMPAWLSS